MSLLACRGLPATLLFSRGLAPRLSVRARPRHQPALRHSPVRASKDMGAAFSSSSSPDFESMIRQKNADNSVMVYSKSYCPYCSEVKGLFTRLNVPYKVVELDELADGTQVQTALARITGRSTVPQVFVGGAHVGGCDDTMAAMNSGKLKELMLAAGISISV